MPRVIILVPSAHRTAHALAETVADGAARVRFTEVEVRAVSSATSSAAATDWRRPRDLEGIHVLCESDAIVVTTSAAPDDDPELRGILAEAERDLPQHAFANTVLAVIGANEPEWLPLIARLGGIIVAVPRGSNDPDARAAALGDRVATVVEWVRHARSHEHGHSHQHSHHHH